MNNPRVSIVHDWLMDFGGAEKVAESLVEAFGAKDIYTLFCDPGNFISSPISGCGIKTSFLNSPFFKKRYRKFLPLFPFAIEQFDIKECDVVISSSHCVAHGIIPKMDQLHICYCHTPLRYAWDLTYDYIELSGLSTGLKSLVAKAGLHYLRMWDEGASKRVDHYVSNSDFVGRRIKRFYGRDSVTIYPPCETGGLSCDVRKGDHFLFASRLVQYKRADLVIKAAKELNIPLRVAGDGPQFEELKELAPHNVTFLGHLSKDELKKEMASARALIFPPLEDFGILPVEAQALGTPVIAYGKGGALETVMAPSGDDFSRATGLFFDRQDVSSIADAVGKFMTVESKFNKDAMTANAKRFSKERFQKEIKEFVESKRQER
jgi:glycosyltransferase involved in cell wall biosynthesis